MACLSVDSLCSMYSVAMACLCWFPPIQNGATPLLVASQNGHTETVELLLQNSGTVNTQREVSLLCPCTNHYSCLVWMAGHYDGNHHYHNCLKAHSSPVSMGHLRHECCNWRLKWFFSKHDQAMSSYGQRCPCPVSVLISSSLALLVV